MAPATSDVVLIGNEEWSLTCGRTEWSRLVCDLTSAVAAPCAGRSSGRVGFRAGAQPYLGARTVRSGDKMIDWVLIPRLAFAVARSLEAVQGRRALAAGSIREPTANIFVTTGRRAGCVAVK